MRTSFWRFVGILTIPLLLLGLSFSLIGKSRSEPIGPINPNEHLIVLVVVDQLRADYLTRWYDLFEPDGFRRLTDGGAWFQNCHYPYTGTVTGSGHASIATGTTPSRHGIVSNTWYDRENAASVYCATTPGYLQVPPPVPEKGKTARPNQGNGSPERLLGPTVADVWRKASGNKSKIVSLSSKDRGAIFLSGRSADVCSWFDSSSGNFVTSSYYRYQLPPWIAAFNKERLVDSWFGKTWEPLRSSLDYESRSGPPEAPGRANPSKMGKSFPHPLTGALEKPGKAYYEAVYTSPMGNELLLSLVKKAVEAENLGHHELPDLLGISFSANDSAGHAWGPDSPEVLDMTLRTDHLLHELLEFLDQKVGKGSYTLILSADHGVCPLPEVSRLQGHPEAMRINVARLKTKAQEFLQEHFGVLPEQPLPIEQMVDDDIYLNQKWLRAIKRPAGEVQAVLAEWCGRQPGILRAYTRSQLVGSFPAKDVLGRQMQLSYHPARSGDVLLVPQPFSFFGGDSLTGTTHGSPHPYDTNVPLLVYGPEIKPMVHQELVRPQAAAAIIAHVLGIKPPYGDYPVPDDLFTQ